MKKIKIIFDIDDVLRDLSKKIRQYASLYFKGDLSCYVDNNYNKEEIELFDFINKDSELFSSLFEYSYENILLCSLTYILSLHAELYCLSTNSNDEAIKHTVEFICDNTAIKKENIFFVPKSSEKIKWVKDNIDDLREVIFIDDRLDTCKEFKKNGISTFWFTKYRSEKSLSIWEDMFGDFPDKGGNYELEKFLFKKTREGVEQ